MTAQARHGADKLDEHGLWLLIEVLWIVVAVAPLAVIAVLCV